MLEEKNTLPPPLWSAHVRANRVKSGDTVEVHLIQTISVRLLDCFAPQRHGLDDRDGEESRAHLAELCQHGTELLLQVPGSIFPGAPDRVMGRLIKADGTDLGAAQVAARHATLSK